MTILSIKERTFNYLLIGLFFLSVSCMATVNFLVNPFGVFPVKPVAGYTDVRFIENVRIYKNFLIKNRSIDGLMLGSSRIEESMNPLPAAWPGMQVYNMAMPGASLQEMLRNLQHANAVTPLKQGMIGLDFFMFSAFAGSVSDFSKTTLLSTLKETKNLLPMCCVRMPICCFLPMYWKKAGIPSRTAGSALRHHMKTTA
jgi:hypothetical protein